MYVYLDCYLYVDAHVYLDCYVYLCYVYLCCDYCAAATVLLRHLDCDDCDAWTTLVQLRLHFCDCASATALLSRMQLLCPECSNCATANSDC